MKPTEIKDLFAELNRYIDPSYLMKNMGNVVELFSHINELLDAEIDGRLVIPPCAVSPVKKYDFKYEAPTGRITEKVVYEWTTENFYWTEYDYNQAVNKIMENVKRNEN